MKTLGRRPVKSRKNENKLMRATICEIIKDNKILLQRKAAGRFGEGKWNGPGGKLKLDETPRDGVIREVKEETGLTIMDPRLVGELDFYFGEKKEPDWVTYIFTVTKFRGTLRPNDEGELRWFKFEDIPYEEMWQDDMHWLPKLIDGKSFTGTFCFNHEATELQSFELDVE